MGAADSWRLRGLGALVACILVAGIVAALTNGGPPEDTVSTRGGELRFDEGDTPDVATSLDAPEPREPEVTAPVVTTTLPLEPLPPISVPPVTVPPLAPPGLPPDVPGPPCPRLDPQPAGSPRARGIYAMDSEGASVRRLGPGVATAVSPAGTEVAFYGDQGQLCIGAVNGTPSRTLRWRLPGSAIAANTHADTPWSPDGTHLIVMRSDPTSDSPHSDVFTVDTRTGYFIRITPSSAGLFEGAAWSGDSSQVAISGPKGLVVVNIDGTQARTLEKRPIDPQLLQWAPLTGHIYARVHNVGDFLIPANGDDPSLLADPDREYDWRADRSAAVKSYGTNADLDVRHPDGTHHSAWSGGAPPAVVYGAYEPRWAFDDHRFFYRAESTQPPGDRAQSIAYLREDASGGKVLFTISAETGLALRAPMPADRAAVVVTSIV